MLDLLLKDLRLAVAVAEDLSTQIPVARAAAARYEQAQARGLGTRDYSAVHLAHV